jgi:hypothetical protein
MAKLVKGTRAAKASAIASPSPPAGLVAPLSPAQDSKADEPYGSFVEATVEYWRSEGFTEEHWSAYVDAHIQPWHQLLIDEFRTSADTCVDRFQEYRRQHDRWRRLIIKTTGVVAILNGLAALVVGLDREIPIPGGTPLPTTWVSVAMAALAAVVASVLAILANLENFGNYIEQAHAHREARELYLDAAREAEYLWQSHVVAFSGRPEACFNARELYRRICERDRELRRKVKDLTQPRKGDGGG